MSKEFNPFELTSGLPLADAEVTVKAMEFGYDAEYMDGEVALAIIEFTIDENGEDARQLYSVGKKFEPADRGARLVHESGENKNLNKQTNYGRFIDALMAMEGVEEFMEYVRAEDAPEPVFDAEWLVGMRFKMGTVQIEMRDKSTKDLIVPIEFLGMEGEEEAPAKAPAKAAAKAAPAKAAGTAKKALAKPKAAAKVEEVEEDETFGIEDDDIRNALIEAAEAADDFDAYTAAALDIEGVSNDRAIQRIAMSSKAGSIWATHGK